MPFSLPDSLALLRRTPAVLDALLRGLPDAWLHADEGPDTWSPYVIVGHLIHGEETDWMARARIILHDGEVRPFEPFDRFAQFERFGGLPLPALLDLFAAHRRENLEALEALDLGPDDLARTGTHPALGTVTLAQLLATWTAHDLSHLAQTSRVMARRHREAVGPWREYLPILG